MVEFLHLCPGGPGFKPDILKIFEGWGCLEILIPRSHLVLELSALGTATLLLTAISLLLNLSCNENRRPDSVCWP